MEAEGDWRARKFAHLVKRAGSIKEAAKALLKADDIYDAAAKLMTTAGALAGYTLVVEACIG